MQLYEFSISQALSKPPAARELIPHVMQQDHFLAQPFQCPVIAWSVSNGAPHYEDSHLSSLCSGIIQRTNVRKNLEFDLDENNEIIFYSGSSHSQQVEHSQ